MNKSKWVYPISAILGNLSTRFDEIIMGANDVGNVDTEMPTSIGDLS
jgi:hypothetical protein